MSDCTPPLDCPPPHGPISITLARVLAEAAAGFPGRKQVYVIANYTPVSDEKGFHIRGPYTDWSDVKEPQREAIRKGELGFFGPFDTSAARVAGGARVTRIDVHYGPDITYSFEGQYTDALFFSVQAVEKFALPYYEHVYGPEYAARVREQFETSELRTMAHFPWSEYTDPPKPPPVVPSGPALVARAGASDTTLLPAGAAKGSVANAEP